MNDKTPKQISRRDAIKILGAVAGASVLANLPSKWNKPELISGVLPAHAQASVVAHAAIHAGPSDLKAGTCTGTLDSTATITPAALGISLRYDIVKTGTVTINSPATPGTATTNASGVASLTLDVTNFVTGNTITVTWSFANPTDGAGSDSQVFTSAAVC